MRLMKKLIMASLVFFAAGGLLFAGAGKEPGPTTSTNTLGRAIPGVKGTPMDPKNIKIACVVYQEDQHQGTITAAAVAAAKKHGVTILTANTGMDIAKEMEFLNTYKTQGVNGLIWAPYSTAMINALRETANGGIALAYVNGTPDPAADVSYTWGVFANDNQSMSTECGKLSAPLIKQKFGNRKIKVATLGFRALAAEGSDVRTGSFLKALDEEGVTYEVVAQQDGWMQDEALRVATDIITAHPDLDVFYSANEGGLVGINMAVKNTRKVGQIYVYGIDCSIQIANMMKQDDIIQIVVGQNPWEGGYQAAEQVIKILMGDPDGDAVAKKGKWVWPANLILDRTRPETIKAYDDLVASLNLN
jgi:ABC-type sugar transport system substrate-binding protein